MLGLGEELGLAFQQVVGVAHEAGVVHLELAVREFSRHQEQVGAWLQTFTRAQVQPFTDDHFNVTLRGRAGAFEDFVDAHRQP